MKKRTALLIALALALALSIHVISSAAQPYSGGSAPILTFDGTIANCYAIVSSPGDEISATLTLRYGGTRCAVWYAKGTSSVTFDEIKEVSRGRTYTLTLSWTINGKPAVGDLSTTAVCN